MHAGDETTHWNDAGPCPNCGRHDCWLGCDTSLDGTDDEEQS